MTQFKGQYRIESARLPGWDYRNAGWYFITICTRDGYAFFGDVVNSEMQLSALGEVALRFWLEIPDHIPGVRDGSRTCGDAHSCTRHSGPIEPRPTSSVVVETLHATSLQLPTMSQDEALLSDSQIQSRAMSALSPKAGSLGSMDPFLQIRRHELGWTERDPRFCLAAALLGSHHPRRTIPAGNPEVHPRQSSPAGSWNDRIRRRFGCNRSRRCMQRLLPEARSPSPSWMPACRAGSTTCGSVIRGGCEPRAAGKETRQRAGEDGQRIEQRISGID